MRTSKPKAAAKIAAVLIAAVLANAALTFALEPYGSKSHLIWEDYAAMAQRGEAVDTVFAGTSFFHNGIDPDVFDAACGTSSFNLASMTQSIEESFIAVQTAYDDFGIKRAIVNISSNELHRSEATNPASTYLRMRSQAVGWPQTIATIASQLFRPETLKSMQSLNCLFPWVENHVDPNASSILQNLQLRLSGTPVIEAASIQDGVWAYEGRGWGALEGQYDPNENPEFYFRKEYIDQNDDSLDPDRERTLRALCDYCNERGIELIAVNMPMMPNNIEYFGERYFGLQETIADLLAEYDVPYYDFNMARPDVFDAKPEYFANNSHLNRAGAEVFSDALGTFLADPAEPGDPRAFYSAQEYWDAQEGVSAIIVFTETVADGVLATCEGVTTPQDAARVEYRMFVRPSGSEDGWQCVRGWSHENVCLYELDAAGLYDIRVEARLADGANTDADFERYREHTVYFCAP